VNGGKAEAEPELVKREAGSIDADPIGFTRNGTFYYKTTNFQSDIYTAELDPTTGQVVSKPALVNQRFVGSASYPVKWSPDGQFLVFTRVSRRELGYVVSKVVSLIVRSDRTGEEKEIVPAPALAESPGILDWFPDGRSLLTCGYNSARLQFRQIDLQTGETKMFLDLSKRASLLMVYMPVLSRDGKTLYYVQLLADGTRLMRRNLESGEEKELYRGTPLIFSVSLSPDGRQLAFIHGSEEPEMLSLMIMPAEGGTPRELLGSKIPVQSCAWINNSRHLLIIRQPKSSAPYELWSVPLEGGEPQPSGLAMPGMFEVFVHPDGRRIAFSSSKEPTEEVWVIKNLLSALKTSRE
jgi:Tol biopolymer transport system component